MSDEKTAKEAPAADKADDVKKQLKSIAFTVRKMKNWMEDKLGADIDGDGRIGGGPYKKLGLILLAFGLAATMGAAENKTAIAYWSSTTYIDADGNMYANGLNISAGAIVGGTLTVSGKVNGVTINSTMITNVIAEGQVLPAVDYSAATNGNAENIASGNLALARITNALVTGTLAANLTGNIAEERITNALTTAVIPLVGITNALETAGPSIGGNVPLAALTNALSGTLYSGTYTNTTEADASTNVIVVLNGVIVSVTTTP